MANVLSLLSDATGMCLEDFDLKPIGTENRFGDTVQHIKRREQFVGQYHKKFITQIHSGARGNTDAEAVMSDTAGTTVTDLAIEESYLRRIDAGIGYSLFSLRQVSGKPNAVFELRSRLKLDVTRGIMEKQNQYLNSDATAKKALVAAVYAADGSGAYGGSATTCFVKIDNGSVANFHQGEKVDIRAASDPASLRLTTNTVTVKDVWPDEYFLGYNVGPGLVLSCSASNFGTVADNDEIVAAGEGDYGYPATFSVVADLSTSPASYFGVTRTTAGNAYLLGHGRAVNAQLDIDRDFGTMFRIYSRFMPFLRNLMKDALEREKVELTDALVCQASPELVAEVAKQAGDSTVNFQVALASSLDEAKRRKLVASTGWNGHVINTPLLPMPIILQPEAQMATGEIRVFDPNCWTWLTSGEDAKGNPEWVPVDERGGIWHNQTSSGQPTPRYTAHCFVWNTPFCEQPSTVYRMTGVTDSL
jgi:hypothetical protein